MTGYHGVYHFSAPILPFFIFIFSTFLMNGYSLFFRHTHADCLTLASYFFFVSSNLWLYDYYDVQGEDQSSLGSFVNFNAIDRKQWLQE